MSVSNEVPQIELSKNTDLNIDIDFLKQIVVAAGDAALERRNGIAVEYKADSSYVTAIDRETEKSLQVQLDARYTGFAFQGEEYGRHGSLENPLWAVDPIDGTTNMVFGIPFWCVSVGLVWQGVPVAGVVYMPATRELFWGILGKGSFCNGVRLKSLNRETFHPEDTLGFTSGAIKSLDVSKLPGRIRCLGSIAAEVVYTAKGALCCHAGCLEGANDLAAALCIAHEAGCTATYMNGDPVMMEDMVREGRTRGPFIVAPPQTAEAIRSLVKPLEKAVG